MISDSLEMGFWTAGFLSRHCINLSTLLIEEIVKLIKASSFSLLALFMRTLGIVQHNVGPYFYRYSS